MVGAQQGMPADGSNGISDMFHQRTSTLLQTSRLRPILTLSSFLFRDRTVRARNRSTKTKQTAWEMAPDGSRPMLMRRSRKIVKQTAQRSGDGNGRAGETALFRKEKRRESVHL